MASPFILCCLEPTAKTHWLGPIVCPGCGDRHRFKRHGFYWRYLPGAADRIAVPRFRCENRQCPRRTFSVLPYPCLRHKRYSLGFYTMLVEAVAHTSLQRLACRFRKGWSAMRRLLHQAGQVLAFFRTERWRGHWGPCPCLEPWRTWTAFTQAQSYATGPSPG